MRNTNILIKMFLIIMSCMILQVFHFLKNGGIAAGIGFLIVFILFLVFYDNRKYKKGMEHGAAKWGKASDVKKIADNRNEEKIFCLMMLSKFQLLLKGFRLNINGIITFSTLLVLVQVKLFPSSSQI
ncbi:hypothetical protein OBG91_11485 [Lactococcus lactis]|nr:hypothetical protein [Lactococcus lactis]